MNSDTDKPTVNIKNVCMAVEQSIQPYYTKPLGFITLVGSYPNYSTYIRQINSPLYGHYVPTQDHETHPTVDHFRRHDIQPVLILIDSEYSNNTSPLIKRITNYKVHNSSDCQIYITHTNLIVVVIPYDITDEIKNLDEFILSQFEKSYNYPTLHFIQYFTGIGHEYTNFSDSRSPYRYQVHSACHYNWGCGFLDFDMSAKISGYSTQSTIFPPIYFNNKIPSFDIISTNNMNHLYTKWLQTESLGIQVYTDYYIGYIKALAYFRFGQEAPFLSFIQHIYNPSDIIQNAIINFGNSTPKCKSNLKMCLNRTATPDVLLSSIWMLLYRRSMNVVDENIENKICPTRITNIAQILSGEISINHQTIIDMCNFITTDYDKSIINFLTDWLDDKYDSMEIYATEYLNTWNTVLSKICKHMGIKLNFDELNTNNTQLYKKNIQCIQHMTKLIYYYPNL
jgi:hypothetical protein